MSDGEEAENAEARKPKSRTNRSQSAHSSEEAM
jgi:hypothetical protein